MPKAVRDAQPQEGSVRVRAVAPLDVAYTQGPRAPWSKGAVWLMSMPLPAYECFRPLSGSAGAVSFTNRQNQKRRPALVHSQLGFQQSRWPLDWTLVRTGRR